MDINLELYKVFYHVARKRSFSEASQVLFISQSAVSQSIKHLEQKMDCRLFIRNTKQVKLTKEGEILYPHIEQALNFIEAGKRSVVESQSLQAGEVRIGASDTICKYFLLPYLKEFNCLYPEIKLHITNRTSPVCMDLLRQGSVDMIVANLPSEVNHRGLDVKAIKKIQDVFIAGNNFAHLRGKIIDLKELEQYPLLMLEKNSTTRKFIDAFLEKKGVRVTPEIELGSMDLLVEMAKIGLGISPVVQDYFTEDVEKGEIFAIKIRQKIPGRMLGIMVNDSMPTPLATQKLIDLLTEHIKEIKVAPGS
ncbi:MAG: LysR family transcriptional regulator [Bacillota bacterium]